MNELFADVIIVGGGPAGLTAALLLGQRNISTLLFETNRSTADHPRGHVVSTRSMEIFRELGLDAAVDAASLPLDRHRGIGFVNSLAGAEIGHIDIRGEGEALEAERAMSPCLKRSCPQDRLEPLLQAAANGQSGLDLRFGVTVVDIAQDADGVSVIWEDSQGQRRQARAKYLIGADGPRGPVREAAGISMDGEVLGQQIGVYFHADLWSFVKDRPWLLWWIYNSQTTGVLISLDGRNRWTYNFPYPDGEDRASFTPERCRDIVRAAIGIADFPVEIRSIMPWRMQARLVDRMHEGRIFLAGDAAHPLPPTGGQGMNTGIADVHNLVWKIDAVLKGKASAALLDSYTPERLAVAKFNVEQSASNARKMADAGLSGILALDPENSQIIDKPEGAELRARMAAAIPAQRGHFDYPGQTFGIPYRSAVILDDGTDPAPIDVTTFAPSAAPGMRLPHLWLQQGDNTLSTLDLAPQADVTLILANDHAAAEQRFFGACDAQGIKGRAIGDGRDGIAFVDAAWRETLALGAQDGLLLRPDGHVAWRGDLDSAAFDAILRKILP